MRAVTEVLRRIRGLANPRVVYAALGALLAACALLLFPWEIQTAVGESAVYCLGVLVPSLFPFMVLSCFVAESGVGRVLGRLLGPVCRFVFRLPEPCAAPILLSFLGGYPAGARAISLLLARGELSEKDAGRAMLFCCAPGPAFVVTFLGGAVLQDFTAGWVLLFCVTLSGLLLGALLGLSHPVPPKRVGTQKEALPKGSALISSVTGAAKSTAVMCSCVMLFSGLTALLRGSGLMDLLCTVLAYGPLSQGDAVALVSFILEVTGGAGDAAHFQTGAPLFAFGLAFGGLCVHLQLFSCFDRFPAKKGKFLCCRVLHGLLAAGFCTLSARLLPAGRAGGSQQVMAPAALFSGSLAGGLSLLLMCFAFLLTVTRERS